MKKILIVLLAYIGLSSCKEKMFLGEVYYTIDVYNRSPQAVYMWRSYDYPDTSLPAARPALVRIRAGSDYAISSTQKWEYELQSKPSRTISIFILDSMVYKYDNWDSIRTHYRVLRRYDLTASDLADSNYHVYYQ